MKKHLRWRYTCDHCGKTGGSAFHLAKHERGCTANPQRVCGMHARCGGIAQTEMAELCKTILDLHPGPLPYGYGGPDDGAPFPGPAPDWNDIQVELQRHQEAWTEIARILEEQADGCPACILAAYRTMKVHPQTSDKASPYGPAFDFKALKAAFWGEHGPQNDCDYGY